MSEPQADANGEHSKGSLYGAELWRSILQKYSGLEMPPLEPSGRHGKDPSEATTSDISTDNDVGRDAMSEEKYLEEMRDAEVRQKKLNRAMQRTFFAFALLLVGVPVLVAAMGFVWMVVQDRMTDAIAAAFFASVVGEVIGLSMILGKHLFPENGLNGDATKKAKKRKK